MKSLRAIPLLLLLLVCQAGTTLAAPESADTGSVPAPVADAGSSDSASRQNHSPKAPGTPYNSQSAPHSSPDPLSYGPVGSWPSGSDSGAWMWRYFLSLVIVGGLMIGVFYMLRRMRQSFGGSAGQCQLRLIGRLPLDRHNTVFQVQTSHEILTLSSGSQGVELLNKEPLPENPSETEEDVPETGRPTFQNRLAALRRTPLSQILQGKAGERNST